jgi:hypothetical protein
LTACSLTVAIVPAFRLDDVLFCGRFSLFAGEDETGDGQMGRIISLYRDWQISGDDAFLRKLRPQAKKALV